jgi:hypothetical protein
VRILQVATQDACLLSAAFFAHEKAAAQLLPRHIILLENHDNRKNPARENLLLCLLEFFQKIICN